MPTQLAPAEVRTTETPPPPSSAGPLARVRGRMNTPRLYWLVAAGLVVLGLLAGTATVAAVQERSALIEDVASASGPVSVDAQTLYRALAEADATAATAFLAGGAEPAGLRQRYLDDIAKATAALTVALRDAGDADAARLRVVADQLPVYTGLVETARSYQRLGVPLGGAYLREASALMQQTLLPASAQVFDSTQRRVAAEQRDASGFPWLVALLALVTAGALGAAQVLVARRSRRVLNPGLVAASLVLTLALLWSAAALTVSANRLETGQRDGTDLVSTLANAGRASLQARANESLTLVARGGGAEFEKTFGKQIAELTGTNGWLASALAQAPESDRPLIQQARDEAARWQELHGQVRELDDGGDWDKAVELATAVGADDLSSVFGRMDAAISDALDTANERVDRQADAAAGALRGLAAGLVLLTLGLVAGVVLGFRPRIGEYR
ncbi:hypothetical protein Aca07nite_58270 [Actinoplanes capillaceus]|uniref:Secreted protein n=1 Tax=Actinoplanes campanulatus TaxID=113559 RepID=A0ABQ3WQP1_9ACTN|nr:hypothetical protein [Actinoplanes capillaceus]GID48552.1 hypothetical protein Aca07nite_58270 [Actinoplanes capillaceus]